MTLRSVEVSATWSCMRERWNRVLKALAFAREYNAVPANDPDEPSFVTTITPNDETQQPDPVILTEALTIIILVTSINTMIAFINNSRIYKSLPSHEHLKRALTVIGKVASLPGTTGTGISIFTNGGQNVAMGVFWQFWMGPFWNMWGFLSRLVTLYPDFLKAWQSAISSESKFLLYFISVILQGVALPYFTYQAFKSTVDDAKKAAVPVFWSANYLVGNATWWACSDGSYGGDLASSFAMYYRSYRRAQKKSSPLGFLEDAFQKYLASRLAGNRNRIPETKRTRLKNRFIAAYTFCNTHPPLCDKIREDIRTKYQELQLPQSTPQDVDQANQYANYLLNKQHEKLDALALRIEILIAVCGVVAAIEGCASMLANENSAKAFSIPAAVLFVAHCIFILRQGYAYCFPQETQQETTITLDGIIQQLESSKILSSGEYFSSGDAHTLERNPMRWLLKSPAFFRTAETDACQQPWKTPDLSSPYISSSSDTSPRVSGQF